MLPMFPLLCNPVCMIRLGGDKVERHFGLFQNTYCYLQPDPKKKSNIYSLKKLNNNFIKSFVVV